MAIQSWFKKFIDENLRPPRPLKPGSYAYQSPPEEPVPFRMHLRIEPDGSGLLILNASTVLHLNQTAAECAHQFINGASVASAAGNIARRYKVSRQQAEEDYTRFIDHVHSLARTPDLDPESFLMLSRQAPYSGLLSAPYRLDCALTYRLRSGKYANGVPQPSVEMEMTPQQWQAAVDIAWKAGVPHLVFTGGEPTLREDLADLLAHAEKNGQVTGLISDGKSFHDEAYLNKIIQNGLDHLMVILDPADEESWAALRVILPADLFTAVHLTISAHNRADIPDVIKRLAEMGANGISLSAADAGLGDALSAARDLAAQLHLNLVWDLPVPYSQTNPVALELAPDETVAGAGRAWLYVEPDGDVFPSQGVTRALGNILREPWDMIWQIAQS